MLASGAHAAETAAPPPPKLPPAVKPYQSPEDRYATGQGCLKKDDIPCAQVALAGITPSSPYAKILEARIAAQRQDYDTVLRLLIPLQAETALRPTALASLHATLALAYENQENALRALEQRAEADRYLDTPEAVRENQKLILQSLAAQPKETLLDMRGESVDTAVQGWIDLALALMAPQRASALAQWHQAYPDHRADVSQLGVQVPAATTSTAAPSALTGKVALLLPLEVPTFAFAAEAVRSGFMAAHRAVGSTTEIAIYPTHGQQEEIAALYRQALAEGAQYVVGPLTRAEVAALQEDGLVSVPTVALNTLDDAKAAPAPEKLLQFGLPVEDEAAQLAQIARDEGMRTAIIVTADNPLSKRMAQAFAAAWTEQEGVVVLQADFTEQANALDLKRQIAAEPADMIFLAADAVQARMIRPYLNYATPTFALSHVYDGNPTSAANAVLNAIHFVDMPWLLDQNDEAYTAYRKTAADLPPDAQRWFAVGVDAWNLLTAFVAHPDGKLEMHGLSGDLDVQQHRVQRELPLAQFRNDGVALE
jgi:outer membrane PBP1 activator LpoA protein